MTYVGLVVQSMKQHARLVVGLAFRAIKLLSTFWAGSY
jgi:hypothetical protein